MFSGSVSRDVYEYLGTIMADFHPRGFQLMAKAVAVADTRDLLPHIRVPTLLVWGDADARSPITVAHQFEAAIPTAKLVVIAGAGHVCSLEAPTRFNAEVRAFCHLVDRESMAAGAGYGPEPR
jgi:pimeloyl-ACP methyl ester carboxylesterase